MPSVSIAATGTNGRPTARAASRRPRVKPPQPEKASTTRTSDRGRLAADGGLLDLSQAASAVSGVRWELRPAVPIVVLTTLPFRRCTMRTTVPLLIAKLSSRAGALGGLEARFS